MHKSGHLLRCQLYCNFPVDIFVHRQSFEMKYIIFVDSAVRLYQVEEPIILHRQHHTVTSLS